MTEENLNNVVETIEREGRLALGIVRPQRNEHVFDGCHVEPADMPGILTGGIENYVGAAAAKAGYGIGDKFKYKITIKIEPKEQHKED